MLSPFFFMLCLLSKPHSLPLYLCMNLSCHFVSCLTVVVPLLFKLWSCLTNSWVSFLDISMGIFYCCKVSFQNLSAGPLEKFVLRSNIPNIQSIKTPIYVSVIALLLLGINQIITKLGPDLCK